MKHSVWLLLACSLAGAIPLHKGETWTWLVVDRETNARQWRSATVLDSAVQEVGVVWRIQARDSLTKEMDTGSILARSKGPQSWKTLSKLLPWEPSPMGSGVRGVTYPISDTSGPLPWGLASLRLETGTMPQYPWTIKTDSGLCRCGYDVGNYILWLTCPEHLWDDSVGVLRARFNGESRQDWILRTHNGKSVEVAPVALAVPEVGATLVWQESTAKDTLPYGGASAIRFQRNEGPFIRTWKVLDRPSDSSEWIRIRILETLHSDSSRRDSAIDLRVNPLTGERIPRRDRGVTPPDDGWWREWTDSVSILDRTRFRRIRYDGFWGVRSSTRTIKSQSWMRIGPENQMDSLAEVQNMERSEGGGRTWDRTTFTRVLMSVDGKVIRPDAQTGVQSLTRRMASLDLLSLAKLHPALVVRWRDARGRSGQILAGDANRSGFGAARGVLFLSAALPDGSRWFGAYLPEMR